MLKRPLGCFVLALSILSPGCISSDPQSSDRSLSQAGPSSKKALQGLSVLPDKVVNQERAFSAALPKRGIVLALTRWGATTLAVFDFSTEALVPLRTATTGEPLVSMAADKLAYLVREGINPADNYIEILDLRQNGRQLVRPAKDFAILGFALSPNGSRLAYSEINLRLSNSRRGYWRTGFANLERHEADILLAAGKDDLSEEGVPIPFAWSSRRREVYLRRLLPFRGMVSQGIWAMKTDGSGLRRILPEPTYTGLPLLSPLGDDLAYLATKIDALPRAFIPSPGPPPGNVLVVMSLQSGEQKIWAHEVGAAFGAFAWSSAGKEIVIAQREWLEGRFRDGAFLRVSRENSLQAKKIAYGPTTRVADIRVCRDRSFFWVEEDKTGASLRGDKTGSKPATLLTLPEGEIRLVGCLGE